MKTDKEKFLELKRFYQIGRISKGAYYYIKDKYYSKLEFQSTL